MNHSVLPLLWLVCAGQSVAELQAKAAPVKPELAVLITPFMVVLSGAYTI
jgi:hypothetical protein